MYFIINMLCNMINVFKSFMTKQHLICSHCGKQIIHGDYALDFEDLIYCSNQCIDDEIIELNNLDHNPNDYEINQIIEEDCGIYQFNLAIVNKEI